MTLLHSVYKCVAGFFQLKVVRELEQRLGGSDKQITGVAALESYFVEKPGLVLLDVTMKEMDGIEVLKRLRELDSRAAVVIVSADVQTSTRELAEQGGAAGFVVKPVTAAALVAAVDAGLQRAEPCN